MRVIGGKYRGRRILSAPGLAVRPTSDRLRESLFNIIARAIDGSRFLDVCAGSGAVGIEALSRGANDVVFVERNRRACSAIEGNLARLGITEDAAIINADAGVALGRLASESREFDIVFLDPPYSSEIYSEVMLLLGTGSLVAGDGIVVVEHRAKSPPRSEYGTLTVSRVVRQGESALAFYRQVVS